MNNFKGKGFKKGGSKFGGKKDFGGGKKHRGGSDRGNRSSGGSPELFSATCAECHKKCELPFKPTNDKPVYCSACFGMKKDANEKRGSRSGDRGGRGSHNHERPDYTKLPRDQRPPRHKARPESSNDGIAELQKQIAGIESKLNKILDLINPPQPSKKETLPEEEIITSKVASKKTAAKVTPQKVAKKTVTKKATKTATKKATKTATKKATKTATKKATKTATKKTAKKVAKKATKTVAKKATRKTK